MEESFSRRMTFDRKWGIQKGIIEDRSTLGGAILCYCSKIDKTGVTKFFLRTSGKCFWKTLQSVCIRLRFSDLGQGVVMPGKQVTILDDERWPETAFKVNLPVETESVALGVIDVQHYGMDPSADLAHTLKKVNPDIYERYSRDAREMVQNIQQLQEAFRGAGRRIFYTRHGSHVPDGGDMIQRRRRREQQTRLKTKDQGHLPIKGNKGHQIIEEVAPLEDELVLDKNTGSAFHSTPIDMFLRNMEIKTLVLSGVAAEQCVFCTALDAADRGFNVIIAADACAGFDPGIIEALFIHFGRVSGYVRPLT